MANLLHITQVVFSLNTSSAGQFELQVDKLEGRPSYRDNEAHHFRVVDDAVVFEDRKLSEQFRIGERVKDLRKKMKMTQTELASQLSLTSGAVSQIENDITVPSLQTLLNLSHVFKQPVDYFLGNDEGTVAVSGYVLCGQGFRITSPSRDVVTRQLADCLPAPMVVYSVSIKGNKTVQGALLMHKGGEFITVTRGTLSLTVSGESFTLKEGESLFLQTVFVYEWRNDSGEPAEFLYLLV
jgi:DNA-binding XRE family transcriptional regulator